MKLRFGDFALINNETLPMHYSVDKWKVISLDQKAEKYGFIQKNDFYYFFIEEKSFVKAYHVETFTKFQGHIYYIFNDEQGYRISPTFETVTALELHFKHDINIIIENNNHIEEIWEERTPIEGFIFDTEPIVFLKGKID